MKKTYQEWKTFWQDVAPLRAGVMEQTGRGRDVDISVIASDISHTLTRVGFRWSGRVIDVGCGNGVLADKLFHFTDTDYMGIDYSLGLIQEAHRRIPWGEIHFVDFKEADPIWVKSLQGDLVLAYSIFHYYPEERDRFAMLQQMIWAAKPKDALIYVGDVVEVGLAKDILREFGLHDIQDHSQGVGCPERETRKDITAWKR